MPSGDPEMTRQNSYMERHALHNTDSRYYVLDYLAHSFPTQLFEVYSDADGNLQSRPVIDEDGQ